MSRRCKTSGRNLESLEKTLKCLELRKQGKTYREIGQELGIGKDAVHSRVMKELNRLLSKLSETAQHAWKLDLERIDSLLSGVWEKAIKGDLGAIEKVKGLLERRAKMIGYDAPTKSTVTVDTTSDRDLLAEADRLGIEVSSELREELADSSAPKEIQSE